MNENEINSLLEEIIDENRFLNVDALIELEEIGGMALNKLNLRLKEILYDIEFELPDSFWIFIKYIVKNFDCETIIEYLNNEERDLIQLTFDLEWLTLQRLLKPILNCYKKGPNTKAHREAISLIKKINNNLLVPLCRELDDYNQTYYNEAIEVLALITKIDEELIRKCLLKVVKYGEDVIYFFHKGKDHVSFDPSLESLDGLLNKLYFHIEQIIEKEFEGTDEIDVSQSNHDSKIKRDFSEMFQYILKEKEGKNIYSREELKSLICENFNELAHGKLELFDYVIVGGNKYFVRDGKLDLSQDIRLHKSSGIKDMDEIEGLEKVKHVIDLDLTGNFITEIKGLDHLTELRFLSLRWNKITEIEGLNALHELRRLNLSNNKITEIKGLDALKKLKWIDLSLNNISELKGLENLVSLQTIKLPTHYMHELEFLKASCAKELVEYCRKKLKESDKEKDSLFWKVMTPTMISLSFLEQCLSCLKSFKSVELMQKFALLLIEHLKEVKDRITETKRIHPVEFLEFVYKKLEIPGRNEFEQFLHDLYDFGVNVYNTTSDETLEKMCLIELSKFWQMWTIKSTEYNNLDSHYVLLLNLPTPTYFYYKKENDSIILWIYYI